MAINDKQLPDGLKAAALSAAADWHHTDVEAASDESRAKAAARTRHLAAYLMVSVASASLGEIASTFGHHQSFISRAQARYDILRHSDSTFADWLAATLQRLEHLFPALPATERRHELRSARKAETGPVQLPLFPDHDASL